MIKRLWKWLTEKEYRIVSTGNFYYGAECRRKIFPTWFFVSDTIATSPSGAEENLKSVLRVLRYPKYKQYLGSEDAIIENKDE